MTEQVEIDATWKELYEDALAALDRVREFVSDCEVGDPEPGTGKNEENREVEARLNDLDYIIRQPLAALDDETLLRLIRESGVKGQTFARAKDGIELDYPKAEIERFAEAVRHLTASGVPYVPEEIRALPEKLRHRYKIGIPNDLGCAIAYELEKMIDRAAAPQRGGQDE